MCFYNADLLRLRGHTHTDFATRSANIAAARDLARSQGATLFELRAALDDFKLCGETLPAQRSSLWPNVCPQPARGRSWNGSGFDCEIRVDLGGGANIARPCALRMAGLVVRLLQYPSTESRLGYRSDDAMTEICTIETGDHHGQRKIHWANRGIGGRAGSGCRGHDSARSGVGRGGELAARVRRRIGPL